MRIARPTRTGSSHQGAFLCGFLRSLRPDVGVTEAPAAGGTAAAPTAGGCPGPPAGRGPPAGGSG